MADLRLNILGNDEASVSLDSVQGKVLGLGKALLEFSKSSVKAFEEQSRADRQLAAVAGESTNAFKAQAAALQESIGVAGSHVEQLQTMLLRYGQAPAEIDGTIRAIEDLSAATGRDATAALAELTTSVTTGKQAFKDLGLQYDTTGSRGDVLRAATKALADKFGGSASADADSLTGSVRIAEQQFGELQTSFGGLIAEFVKKTQVIESATWAFKNLNAALFGEEDQRLRAVEKLQHAQKLIQEYEVIEKQGVQLNQTSRDTLHEAKINYYEAAKLIEQLDAAKKKSVPAATGAANNVAAGKRASGSDDSMSRFKESLQERISAVTDAAEREAKLWDEHDRAQARVEEEAERDRLNAFKENLDERIDAITDAYREEARLAEEQDKAHAKEEARYAKAGEDIGTAFATSLSGAIGKLAEGQEMDLGETVGDILAAVLGVAGSVIGTLLLPGAGTAIGGAIGGIAGSAIKGATRRKRHSGGYAGDGMARYHAGTWVGSDEEAAVLQNGERVLGRHEVAAMGGPQGVERAVRGGGGTTINVSTLDGSTAREYFERAGGRALIDAVRSGRGAPRLLWGGR